MKIGDIIGVLYTQWGNRAPWPRPLVVKKKLEGGIWLTHDDNGVILVPEDDVIRTFDTLEEGTELLRRIREVWFMGQKKIDRAAKERDDEVRRAAKERDDEVRRFAREVTR